MRAPPFTVLVVVVSLFAACGDDGDSETVRRLADTIGRSGELSEDQATCVARRIVSHVGEDEVRALLDEPPGGTPPEDLVAETTTALVACDVDPSMPGP